MIIQAKKLAWLMVPLCLGGSLWAQDTSKLPSQKTKEAVDKLKAGPGAAGNVLHDLKTTVGTKLGLAEDPVKTAKVTSETGPMLAPEVKTEDAMPPAPSVVRGRDPFRPFTLHSRRAPTPREKLSPLERYDLGQLKLVGVIWDVKVPNAMVEDSTGLGYVVRIGTPIGSNEGKVTAIEQSGLVIEEYQYDFYGAKKKVQRNMKLAPEKAE